MLSRGALTELAAGGLSHFFWWISQVRGLAGYSVRIMAGWSFPWKLFFLFLFKNQFGKAAALSGKTLCFLIVVKDPKIKAGCMGLVSLAGSQRISWISICMSVKGPWSIRDWAGWWGNLDDVLALTMAQSICAYSFLSLLWQFLVLGSSSLANFL